MEQADLLRHTVSALEGLNVPYMLVGSFASTVYGEPRFTQDIDIVFDLPSDAIPSFCAAFPPPEFYLSADDVAEAVRARFQFNLLHPGSGNKIDFIIARSDEWGKEQLRRRQRVQILSDQEAYAAAPEDVIIGKLWYYSEGGSEKHLRDIASMLKISGASIDRGYVDFWAKQLGYEEAWQAILTRLRESEKGP